MQETREIMTQHLAFAKWKESAFSTEQLKGVRWLLGARPRGLPEALLEPLTMTPMAQSMMMQLHVKKFPARHTSSESLCQEVCPCQPGRLWQVVGLCLHLCLSTPSCQGCNFWQQGRWQTAGSFHGPVTWCNKIYIISMFSSSQ